MPGTPTSSLPNTFTEPLPRIERALADITARHIEPASLRDAVEYALLGGGKRVRPLLVWHAAEATRPGSGPDSLPAAAAVEMIHAFSLVHDDLPAIDDDDLRRGRPTLHKARGEAMAVLAGDALLNLAFAALSEIHEPALAHELTREMTRGTGGMIAGQVLDTLGPTAPDALPDRAALLRRIHEQKTGALITASCRMGALVGLARSAGGPPDQPTANTALAALSRYGEAIGLLFQVVDDLIDVEQPAEHAGKRTGKDVDAGKLTYPGLHGVDASRAEIARLADDARAALDALPPHAQSGPGAPALRGVVTSLATRTR